jgi:hypothetical protein
VETTSRIASSSSTTRIFSVSTVSSREKRQLYDRGKSEPGRRGEVLLNRITGHSVMEALISVMSPDVLCTQDAAAMETLTRTAASKHDDSNRA